MIIFGTFPELDLHHQNNKGKKERNHLVLPLPLSSSTAPSSPHSPADDPPDRGFFIRMKSTLTKRGLHVKSSGYKVETSEEIIYQTSKTYLVSCILFYFPVPGMVK